MKKRKLAVKSPSKSENTDEETEKQLLKLGERIKQLRVKKGYTSYEIFAFENGINRAQFGRYERGEDLRYSSLLKVMQALGVTQKEFFSEGFD
jgi:transcriptional regulator with XRE-family HTH domain